MLNAISQLFEKLTADQKVEVKPDEPLAIAALLIDVATSDGHLDERELNALTSLLEKQFDCEPNEVNGLIERAKSSHDDSICLYRYTSVVKQASLLTRQKVIAGLWRIAYADGHLDPHEEASIRKVADLLYISHSDFMKAKHSVLDEI